MIHTSFTLDAAPGRRAQLLMVFAAVAATMVLLLNLGFWIAGDNAPRELRQAMYVAVLAWVLLGRVWLKRAWVTARGRRLAMASRPTLPVAPAAPNNTGSAPGPGLCPHLQPIEQAMRMSGVAVRLQYGHLEAHCRIDLPRFGQRFGPSMANLYVERHEIDRSVLDPKTALFWCAACASRLYVVHPEQALVQTPCFPSTDGGVDDAAAVVALQNQVIKALLAGKRVATAHKEGGTHVYFDGQPAAEVTPGPRCGGGALQLTASCRPAPLPP